MAHDESVLSATRLQNLSSFVEVLTVAVTGLLIVKVRRNKPFMVAGAVIQVLAYGLMTRYGDTSIPADSAASADQTTRSPSWRGCRSSAAWATVRAKMPTSRLILRRHDHLAGPVGSPIHAQA